jgi:uncharacterized membrane protein YkvA (DUF1232 family)
VEAIVATESSGRTKVDTWLVWLLSAVAALVLAWLVLLALLGVARPQGINTRAAMGMVPDLLRLLRALARDPSVSRGVRVRLFVLLVYVAVPLDLVPDFIPVIGYADDLIVIGLVLRSVVRRAGPDVVTRHWSGSPEGLLLVRRLAGLGDGSPDDPRTE